MRITFSRSGARVSVTRSVGPFWAGVSVPIGRRRRRRTWWWLSV